MPTNLIIIIFGIAFGCIIYLSQKLDKTRERLEFLGKIMLNHSAIIFAVTKELSLTDEDIAKYEKVFDEEMKKYS